MALISFVRVSQYDPAFDSKISAPINYRSTSGVASKDRDTRLEYLTEYPCGFPRKKYEFRFRVRSPVLIHEEREVHARHGAAQRYCKFVTLYAASCGGGSAVNSVWYTEVSLARTPALGTCIVNIHFPAHVVVQRKNREREE